MNIERYNNKLNYSLPNKMISKKDIAFSLETKEENGIKRDPLIYYKKLCEEFPDVSFRLDDKETGIKDTSKICLGYQGSMNQVGNNFGGIGQCSINIDVSVIRNMQNDPEYAENVKGMIRFVERTYSDRERETRLSGMMYTVVNIDDENGELVESTTQSMTQASTEEEVRRMWNMSLPDDKAKRIFEQMEESLMNNFLMMLDGKK